MFDHTLQILTNRIFLLLTKNKLLAYSLAILFALGFGIAIPMSPALAYTCYGAYGDCFATNAWGGRIGGGFTHVTVVQLNAPGNQSQPQFDYVREELYVGDSTSSSCTYHSPCYSEVGYGTFSNNGFYEAYYYAWVPPNGAYNLLEFGIVPSSSYGQVCYFRNDQQKNGILNVGVCDYAGININLSLVPSEWEIGLELAGSHGSAAPAANFTDNIYYDPSLNQYAYFEQVPGSVISESPTYGTWRVVPNHSNYGGDFETSCGC